ncbi:hypothetical protein [Siminovitchia sp. 179-K 8D1 HS]
MRNQGRWQKRGGKAAATEEKADEAAEKDVEGKEEKRNLLKK